MHTSQGGRIQDCELTVQSMVSSLVEAEPPIDDPRWLAEMALAMQARVDELREQVGVTWRRYQISKTMCRQLMDLGESWYGGRFIEAMQRLD